MAALGLRLRRFAIGPLHPPVRRDGSLSRYQQPAGVGGRLRSCLDARMPSPSLMSVSSAVSIPIVGGCICSCPAIALPHHHLRFARFIPVTMQPSVSRPNAAYVLRHACMATDNPHSAAPGRRLPLRQDGGQRGLQRVGTEPRPRYLLASTAITVLGAGSGICLAIASRLMAGTVGFFRSDTAVQTRCAQQQEPIVHLLFLGSLSTSSSIPWLTRKTQATPVSQ